MEKKKPHVSLKQIHALLECGRYRVTRTAREGAILLGFGEKDMLKVISGLKPSDFFKSMTTYADHTVWQDVYRPKTSAGQVYVKLTVNDDVLIVSFKEL